MAVFNGGDVKNDDFKNEKGSEDCLSYFKLILDETMTMSEINGLMIFMTLRESSR